MIERINHRQLPST